MPTHNTGRPEQIQRLDLGPDWSLYAQPGCSGSESVLVGDLFYGTGNNRVSVKPIDIARDLLGLVEALCVILSYTKALLFPYKPEENLEEWVANRFGYRLYQIFFRTYTEKV